MRIILHSYLLFYILIWFVKRLYNKLLYVLSTVIFLFISISIEWAGIVITCSNLKHIGYTYFWWEEGGKFYGRKPISETKMVGAFWRSAVSGYRTEGGKWVQGHLIAWFNDTCNYSTSQITGIHRILLAFFQQKTEVSEGLFIRLTWRFKKQPRTCSCTCTVIVIINSAPSKVDILLPLLEYWQMCGNNVISTLNHVTKAKY